MNPQLFSGAGSLSHLLMERVALTQSSKRVLDGIIYKKFETIICFLKDCWPTHNGAQGLSVV